MKRLLALALILVAATPMIPLHPSGPWSAAVRDNMLTQIESELHGYFFIERLPKIRTALEANRSRLVAIADPQAFADATTHVLYGATHDKHVEVDYSPIAEPVMAQHMTGSDRKKFDELIRYYAYSIRGTANLAGNIGYLRIDGFAPGKAAYAMIDRTMGILANTDALIIDLRQNGGGSARCVNYLLGYFFDSKKEVSGMLTRDRGKVVVNHKYATVAVGGPKYLNKPVFVLTSSDTISAGEQFPYDLQALKRATIVGETTAGGANPGRDHALTENFTIFVPIGSSRNPITGSNWEGVGVVPDVKTTSTGALLEAYTLALKAAQNSADFAVESRAHALANPAKALKEAFPPY